MNTTYKNAFAPCIISRLPIRETPREESMVPDRSRGTYLLEASVHDSDLLARELCLSQKFLYRYRSGGLLPRPRALEVEERLFRSRRVRRRCHDLWSCRRLNCRKPTDKLSLPASPCSFYVQWPARLHHRRHVLPHHTSHRAFPLSICRRVSLNFFPSRRDLASIGGSAKLSFERRTAKYFPHDHTLTASCERKPRATCTMRSVGNGAGCNVK